MPHAQERSAAKRLEPSVAAILRDALLRDAPGDEAKDHAPRPVDKYRFAPADVPAIFRQNQKQRKPDMPGLLNNHIAVVTGAGSGIGRAIATGYALEGARVVLLDLDEKSAADAVAEIRGFGDNADSF